MNKTIAVLAVLSLTVMFGGLSQAAVPDILVCDAQPSVIHATADPLNPSTTEITVQLETDEGHPVKMCGVVIKCESQNTDILHNGLGRAILEGTTNEDGRVVFTYYSTGDRRANVGDDVEIICRSLQQTSDTCKVSVKAHVPDMVELSKCPDGHAYSRHDYPDIIADGESKVMIAAQLKDEESCTDQGDVPVKKEGIKVKFVSLDTSIVKSCADGTDMVISYTNDQGVAYAEFCSSGMGEENEGTATIEVEVDGGYGIEQKTITVETTRNYGTTTINGKLWLNTIPLQILADGESTVEACVQLRKDNGLIIRNPPAKLVSFVSHDTSKLIPVTQADPNNPGYTEAEEDGRFPQGGIYTAPFMSAGIYDPNSVRDARIEASAEFFDNDDTEVELVGSQYWPASLNVIESPGELLCDGVSETKITAQLLDKCGYPVFMEGREVVFKSHNPELLEDNSGEAIAHGYTDEFGKAYAWFKAKECKLNNVEGGNADITVSTISDEVSGDGDVYVHKPYGFVPDCVNVYTDQYAMGYGPLSEAANAAPALISADGEKPVFVTAQVGELVKCSDYTNQHDCDNQVYGRCEWKKDKCTVKDSGKPKFCNPVKRDGIRIEFKVKNDNIVMNKDHDGPEDGVDYVYLYTDAEGTATAMFRSTGTTPGTNEGCTDIKVTGQDGVIFADPAYARVCAVQHEGMTPNAVFVWAQPAFITADGTSHTNVRAALYWCTPDYRDYLRGLASQGELSADDLMGTYPSGYCKPVQYEGALVKFETMDQRIVDDGMGGKIILDSTDEYGQAQVTFQSAGFQEQNIGPAEIKVFVDQIGEDVTQINKLFITTKEKTWPWCEYILTNGAADADTNNDQFISDSELLHYIILWATGVVDDGELLSAITAWMAQL